MFFLLPNLEEQQKSGRLPFTFSQYLFYFQGYEGLRLLTHVRLVRQNVLILSEVSLYMERSKNLEKRFLRGFDRKNKVFGISRNLIDRFVFK